jgi:hypothetical protein
MIRALGMAVALILLAWGVLRGQDDSPPDLDILFSSTVHTTPEHRSLIEADMKKDVLKAIRGLKVVAYDQKDKPVDGKAKVRLVVEHHGEVTLANQIQTARRNEGGDDVVLYRINGRHQGEVRFRLMEWDGKAYRPLLAWGAEFVDPRGRVVDLFSERIGRGMAIPPMPMSRDEAIKLALTKLGPGNIEEAVSDGLCKAELLRAEVREEGQTLRAAAEVRVHNLSPWPIRHVEVMLEWEAGRNEIFRMNLRQDLPRAVAPRQGDVFIGQGFAAVVPARELRPPKVVGIVFGK